MRTRAALVFVLDSFCIWGCGQSPNANVPATAATAELPNQPAGSVGQSGSWPSWRGAHRDAVSSETGLLDSWPAEGPPLKWKAEGLGGGYSSVAIDSGRIFTMGKLKDGCNVLALNFANGRRLWALRTGGDDPNSTPTVDGDRVYAIDRDGTLVCLDVSSGRLIWDKSLTRDFGGRMMSGWGFSESPLVDGDRLLCTPGVKDALIVALDKKTGKTVWKAQAPANLGTSGTDGAGYSSIVISNGGGVKQYVQIVGRGVVAVRADDGKFLWNYNRIANATANIPTPLVKDNYVFASTGYSAGAALLQLSKSGDGVTAKEVYFLNAGQLQNHHGGMVLVGDYIYCGKGHNAGFPVCLELKTGKFAWEGGRGPGEGSAAVIEADGNLYFRYQSGVMALIEATPKKYILKGKFRTATKNGEGWPHPVIVDRQLFLRDQDVLLSYDIAKKDSAKSTENKASGGPQL
jgi:outer membrane protein assembly factor BamB